MRKGLLLALLTGGLFAVATAFTAEATPVAPAKLTVQSIGVTKVAGGCGRFHHWSHRFRRCVHN
jgi:hypothetical protein